MCERAVQLARRLDAAHAGHADVEEGDVGTVLLAQRDRLDAVGGLGDDAQFRPDGRQARAQQVAHRRFVVGDHGGDHAAVQVAHASSIIL